MDLPTAITLNIHKPNLGRVQHYDGPARFVHLNLAGDKIDLGLFIESPEEAEELAQALNTAAAWLRERETAFRAA